MSDSSSPGALDAICGVFLALSIVIVGLRFYTRSMQKLPLGIDDWAMLPCVVLYIGAAIVVILGVNDKVFGYATSDFTEIQVVDMAKRSAQMQVAWDILSTCALACIKISAIFFYRRIFCVSGNKTYFSIATLATAIIVFLWLVAFLLLTGFQCGSHFSAMWNGTYVEYCTVSFPFLYGLVISDFLLDVWILALPVPPIFRLHTTSRRKLAIMGVFLLALVGLGASIARMTIYIQILTAGPEALIKYDEEVTITKALYFSMLEAGMSFVAVNLPSLSFLMSKQALRISVHSLRSIFSLPSSASSNRPTAGNDASSHGASKGDAKDSFSTSSRSNLARHTNREAYERFEMLDQGASDAEKGL